MTESTNHEEQPKAPGIPPAAPPAPAAVTDQAPEVDAAQLKDTGPQVPKPHDRPAEIDRKIRSAVDRMLEEVQNPYELVIVAAQEARRLNERRLKARSILNQALEHVDELVPDVPFVPRPVEDEEPEVKATNEALERMATGIVEYEIQAEKKQADSYYEGEIDFPLYPDESDEEASGES
jgi:DNA-directed RNA polymerase omega subunit